MLTRMVDASLRLTPDWDAADAYSAAGTTLASLVPAGTYISAPSTDEEMDQSIRYMLSTDSNTLKLRYDTGVTSTFARQVMQQALRIVKTYCEQCYNAVTCTYSISGDVTLTFSAASAGATIQTYRDETMGFRHCCPRPALAQRRPPLRHDGIRDGPGVLHLDL